MGGKRNWGGEFTERFKKDMENSKNVVLGCMQSLMLNPEKLNGNASRSICESSRLKNDGLVATPPACDFLPFRLALSFYSS